MAAILVYIQNISINIEKFYGTALFQMIEIVLLIYSLNFGVDIFPWHLREIMKNYSSFQRKKDVW